MTSRIRPSLAAGSFGLAGILAAVLFIQLVSDDASGRYGTSQQPRAQSTALAAVTSIADASPTVAVSPTIDVGVDGAMVEQAVVDYLELTDALRDVAPTVLLSVPVFQQQLIAFGLAYIPYAPDCQRPMYLVIVEGDFDVTGLAPGFGSQPPVPYIGFVYDVEADTFSHILPSENGDIFRQALNDSTLPTPLPDSISPPIEEDGSVSCETLPAAEGPTPFFEATTAP